MLKKIFLFIILIIWVVWWYSLVSWSVSLSSANITLAWKLSENIFLGSEGLNSTILIYKSDYDIKDFTLHSTCNVESKFLNNYNNLYFFEVKYLDKKCNNPNIVLKYQEQVFSNTIVSLNFVSYVKVFGSMVDYDTEYLSNIKVLYENELDQLAIFDNYNETSIWKYFLYLRKKRLFNEEKFKLNIVNDILAGREKKYIVPVVWEKMPTQYNRVPNSPRSYRSSYTDWVHHGWDIYTKLWQEVVALDDGIIIRVVDNFDYSDLSKLKMWVDLTDEDKLRNLDILRWNQVWLKTSKWDVVFYSHLWKVNSLIEEWIKVKAWTPLGNVGISWVPDKSYTDYHLHFPIQKNPYDKSRVGTYDIVDYMKWDWMFKWESYEYILEHQWEVFED